MWNYSYILPSAMILLIFLAYYFFRARLPLRMNASFVMLLMTALITLAFDYISSQADESYESFSIPALYMLNFGFFIFFLARSYYFARFTFDVLALYGHVPRPLLRFSPFVFIAAELITVSTPLTHIIFYIDGTGYHSGSHYILLAINNFIYILLSLIPILMNARRLTLSVILPLFFSQLILLMGNVIRVMFPKILIMDTFSLMAIIVLFLAFQNPEQFLSNRGTSFNRRAFQLLLDEWHGKRPYRILSFVLHNYNEHRGILGGKQMDEVIVQIDRFLTLTFPQVQLFYLDRGRFALVGSERMDLARTRNIIQGRFDQPWQIDLQYTLEDNEDDAEKTSENDGKIGTSEGPAVRSEVKSEVKDEVKKEVKSELKVENVDRADGDRAEKDGDAFAEESILLEISFAQMDSGVLGYSSDRVISILLIALENASRSIGFSDDSIDDAEGTSTVQQISDQLLVKQALDAAVEHDAVEVYLQPLVDSRTRRIVAAEALARIRDENHGIISPGLFIPMAEKDGQIIPLGEQVFRKVCRLIRDNDLPALGLNWINVNLSPYQLASRDLAQRFSQILQQSQVSPDMVLLEITEQAIMDHSLLQRQLQNLQAAGFQFVLDDYGSGHSNLIRLREHPFRSIKLDMEIVWSYCEDPFPILPAFVRSLKDMGYRITAEGIEDANMARVLSDLGCDYLQGFHYGRPAPAEEFLLSCRRKLQSEHNEN